MNESSDSKNSANSGEDTSVSSIVKLTLAFLVCGFSMYWTWNFVGPSGETTDLGSFLLLWLREIVLFGFFGIVFIAGGFVWLLRFIRKIFTKSENKL